MELLNSSSKSFWLESTKGIVSYKLSEDMEVDVAIVGGGMVGIQAAYLLKKEGLKVAVVEADKILRGTTGFTTAKITSQHSLIYHKLVTNFGHRVAQDYAIANEEAKEFIYKTIEENNIDCDFSRESAYVYAQEDNYLSQVKKEADTASSLGLPASFEKEVPLPFATKGAVKFDNQAQFHPAKYLLSLVNQIHKEDDPCIYENTRAIDIKDNVLITASGKIKSKFIVIASHFPFYDGLGFYFSRLHAERSYVIGAKIKEEYPGGMYINAESPTRSLRATSYNGDKLILIGGENHKTGQSNDTSKHYKNLVDFASNIYTVEDIPFHWSTQDLLTLDDIPYIGKLTSGHDNIFVATGFGKWGMTQSTISALVIKDLITVGKSNWEALYNPSRFTPTPSVKTFVKENLNVASNLITGKLSTLSNHATLVKDDAIVLEGGGQKIGIYKDEEGLLHMVDTTCTHMGCELRWNNGEKSWDCPCHGSRFNYLGEVIEGPAIKKLSYNKTSEEVF